MRSSECYLFQVFDEFTYPRIKPQGQRYVYSKRALHPNEFGVSMKSIKLKAKFSLLTLNQPVF